MDYSNQYIKKQKIPPKVIDFWYFLSRNSLEAIHNFFIEDVRKRLQKNLEKPTLLHIDNFPGPIDQTNPIFSTLCKKKEKWLLKTKELENNKSMKDYLPSQRLEQSAAWHALTCSMSFSQNEYQENKNFALYLHTQPAVNNRDFPINSKYCKSEDPSEQYTMFEYGANTDASQVSEGDRWRNQDGHYILTKRVRREHVEDQAIAQKLAPYTHMFEIQRKTGTEEDRETGIKTLGDHVGIGVSFKDACELFSVLTVSCTTLKT